MQIVLQQQHQQGGCHRNAELYSPVAAKNQRRNKGHKAAKGANEGRQTLATWKGRG